jgi:hypothetical protein
MDRARRRTEERADLDGCASCREALSGSMPSWHVRSGLRGRQRLSAAAARVRPPSQESIGKARFARATSVAADSNLAPRCTLSGARHFRQKKSGPPLVRKAGESPRGRKARPRCCLLLRQSPHPHCFQQCLCRGGRRKNCSRKSDDMRPPWARTQPAVAALGCMSLRKGCRA